MEKSNQDIKISAIISCYHGKNTIYEAIKSLHTQKYSKNDYEIIVIDNGSIDGSTLEIQRFQNGHPDSNLRVYRIENNGLSSARNYGFNIALGKYIFYMDDDAIADADCLKNLEKEFESDYNLIGGKVGIWNTSKTYASIYHYSIFNYWMEKGIIIGTNMAFSRKLLIDTGGFITEFIYRGDESAFMAKYEERIKSKVVQTVIVRHTQIDNLSSFLKSRYQNGAAKSLINRMFRINDIHQKASYGVKTFVRFITSGIMIPLLCIFSLKMALFFTVLNLLRTVLEKDLLGSISMYLKSKSEHNLSYFRIPYIFFMIYIGNIYEDVGYFISTVNNIFIEEL